MTQCVTRGKKKTGRPLFSFINPAISVAIIRMYNTPLDTLRKVFGYDAFRPQQLEIIEGLIQGEDAFVLMPTGGGKSLCYQIPALHREGVGIVVSPLISLMKDQVDALKLCGVRAAYYNSSLAERDARRVLAAFHTGELDLLYVAPERLLNEDFQERLRDRRIALFAIDEAHCISQWGHDFRPEYVKLGRLRRLFPSVPLIALTATAEPHTRKDIRDKLHLQQANCFVAGFDRPNIRYTVLDKHDPFRQLTGFVAGRRREAGIVYCLSRKRVETVAERLKTAGFAAAPYHAGLAAGQRQQVQEDFLKDEIRIIVATVAFGMGIDKSDIRYVVHYDIPKNIESYYQETGRAGRDGLAAEALLLFGYGDIAVARGLIGQTTNPERKRIELHKLNAMAGFAEAQSCRRRVLLGYFGERLKQDCGNCDTCLNPPVLFDATEDARKALSCVYRLNQRFGMGHVIEVLRGSRNQKLLRFGHHRLSTYGIGKDRSREFWACLLRHLIHHGYLVQDVENYSVLQLTEEARPLLRGERSLTMAEPRIRVKQEKKPARRPGDEIDYDPHLFEKLRTLRKQLADSAGVPPFVVFSDVSLMEMAATQPIDEQGFLEIHGVGAHKLKRYGDDFLDTIRGHKSGEDEQDMQDPA